VTFPKLLIRRPSFFGPEPVTHRLSSADTVEVPFGEVKLWLRNGSIARHLFRYSEVELLTHRIAYISKPFLTAFLLRVLSHGPCFFADDAGDRLKIDLHALFRYLLRFLWDLTRIPFLLLNVWWKLREMERREAKRTRSVALDLMRSPVYLRGDLLFGLSSGGSVGHTAGVLNQLDKFAGKPIFVTTDPIPLVRGDIETHVVLPTADYCGFEGIPPLHFNRLLKLRAGEALGGRPVAFVYQRYGVNSFCGLDLARQIRAPFVLEYNGSEIWVSQNWGKPFKYEAIALRIETLLLKSADLVVVVSEPLRHQLRTRGVPVDHILVNPNGVDADRYSPAVDGTQIRQRYGLEGKRVVGFIGTFGRWHGAEVLADAFGRLLARHPDWRNGVRLLLIGNGLTMPEVEARLHQHAARDMAVLTGLVPQEEGPAHLAACDLLISPHVQNPDGSPFFGSPTKIFEYMSMGRGIIASNLDQIGQVLRHGVTAWMVPPGDVEALVSAMEQLISNEPLARALGLAARREVLAHYTWEEHTRRIVQALHQRVATSG
jgi:glycosyltransferase involved in cell wall biosynthesis